MEGVHLGRRGRHRQYPRGHDRRLYPRGGGNSGGCPLAFHLPGFRCLCPAAGIIDFSALWDTRKTSPHESLEMTSTLYIKHAMEELVQTRGLMPALLTGVFFLSLIVHRFELLDP